MAWAPKQRKPKKQASVYGSLFCLEFLLLAENYSPLPFSDFTNVPVVHVLPFDCIARQPIRRTKQEVFYKFNAI